MSGINGRILRIDLESRRVNIERPPEIFYRTYFGGRSLIGYYLLKEVPKGVDALSPDNLLIFSAGPIVGSPVTGTGRNSVGAKTPLTKGFGDSEAGGFWGVELKKAGYDAIIIKGSSKTPVYLSIKDGNVEFRDASHLWGKKTAEVEKIIKDELGDKKARICQIGPAGENLIPYANITNDLTHFYGRTGIGAVMGSKKVRAIAVRGTGKVNLDNKEGAMELAKWMGKKGPALAKALHEYGTSWLLIPHNHLGGLPTRNFTQGQFEGAKNISGEYMKETGFFDRDSCFGCSIRCKRVVKTDSFFNVDPVYGAPEFETLASLGSLCGIDNLEAVCLGNQMCNAYGLDTISTGVSIAFAMECYEKGILTKKDTGGIDLKFGNSEAMLEMIEQIVDKKGLGAILSQGVKEAANTIGKESIRYAMQVNGQEIPMHEPRLKAGLGLGYAISPTGADHAHNMHDTYFAGNVDMLKPLGIFEPLRVDDLGPKKVRMLCYFVKWRHFANCAHYCWFVPWNFDQMISIVKYITGWQTSLWELMKIGERAENLARIFNCRERLTNEQNLLPQRFFEEKFDKGPLKGVSIKRQDYEAALQLYYSMMGWDQRGIPTEGKLHELNIGWVIESGH